MTTAHATYEPVTPHSLDEALNYVRHGGTLIVPTYTRCTIINPRTLRSFEAAGDWLLREDGDGYRLHQGRGSVYLFPGQLKYA